MKSPTYGLVTFEDFEPPMRGPTPSLKLSQLSGSASSLKFTQIRRRWSIQISHIWKPTSSLDGSPIEGPGAYRLVKYGDLEPKGQSNTKNSQILWSWWGKFHHHHHSQYRWLFYLQLSWGRWGREIQHFTLVCPIKIWLKKLLRSSSPASQWRRTDRVPLVSWNNSSKSTPTSRSNLKVNPYK